MKHFIVLLILLLSSKTLLSNSWCNDLYLNEIRLQQSFKHDALYLSFCNMKANEYTTGINLISELLNDAHKLSVQEHTFVLLMQHNLANKLQQNSLAYETIREAYFNVFRIEDSLLKVIVLASYAEHISKYNISHEIALKSFNGAYSIVKMQTKPDASLAFYLTTAIAKIQLKQQHYDDALLWFNKALTYATDTQDILTQSSSLNNIGYAYYKMNNTVNAVSYFNKALDLLNYKNTKHLNFKANVLENIAHVYKVQSDYKNANLYYTNASDLFNQVNNSQMQVRASLFNVLLLEHDVSATQALGVKAKQINFIIKYLHHNQKLFITSGFNDLIHRFYLLLLKNKTLFQDLLPKEFSFELLWQDYNLFLQASKTLQKTVSKNITQDYAKLLTSLHQKELTAQQHKTKQLRSTYLMLVVILILMVITTGVLWRNRALKLSSEIAKRRVISYKNSVIEQDLAYKNADIVNLSNQLNLVNQLKQNLLESVQAFIDNTISKDQFLSVLNDAKIEQGIEQRLQVLKSDVKSLNNKFMLVLLEKYPKLSKTEREICAYIRLGLSVKEMAAIRKTSENAIKMSRSRIRKKLKLSKDQDLNACIAKL